MVAATGKMRYEGRCLWCTPTALAEHLEKENLRNSRFQDIMDFSYWPDGMAYEAGLQRMPKKWREDFRMRVEEAYSASEEESEESSDSNEESHVVSSDSEDVSEEISSEGEQPKQKKIRT